MLTALSNIASGLDQDLTLWGPYVQAQFVKYIAAV